MSDTVSVPVWVMRREDVASCEWPVPPVAEMADLPSNPARRSDAETSRLVAAREARRRSHKPGWVVVT